MDARRRLVPPVACPRCRSPRTKIRFTRYYETRQAIIRHRECRACRARFRTEAPTERYAGMDPAAP
jgi:transcriptional regulator NrdR family protein